MPALNDDNQDTIVFKYFNKGKKHLDNAAKFFRTMNDLEGLALVEFNRSLLFLALKEFDNSIDHFRLSGQVAYPMPSPSKREMWRDAYVERAKENGFDDVENYI